jgi:PAS domain S-box-containing protein
MSKIEPFEQQDSGVQADGNEELVWTQAESEPFRKSAAHFSRHFNSDAPLRGARILWVEDNLEMREFIRLLLAERFEVEAVADGLAALESARANPPDLVLSDVMMPKLDGFGLLRELRADPRLGQIPIILLSALDDEETRIVGMEWGADDYLVKPFSPRELLARIESHLRLAHFRRKAMEAVRESEERFRLATNAGKVGIWDWNVQANTVTWSDMIFEIHGLEPSQFKGTVEDFAALIHPDDREYVSQSIRRALHEDRLYELEFRAVRPDGNIVWIYTRAQVLRDAAGAPVRMLGGSVDITNRKQIEEALQQLNEKLEQRVSQRTHELEQQNQRLRRLANQLSETEERERRKLAKTLHDGLQQILIAGKIQLSLLGDDDFEETVKNLEELFDEAISVSRLLTYDLSPPVLHSSDLPEALNWVAQWFYANYRFEVRVKIGDGIPVVPDRIKSFLFAAVRELLLNSVKHSGVKTATVELYSPQPRKICIIVADGGRGFETARLEREEPDLFGFGLFNIRERLLAMGGAFEINSSLGAGTRSVLTIPLPREAPRKKAETGPLAGKPGSRPLTPAKDIRRIRILIVDDHSIVRRGLIALIGREADMLVVGEAGNGQEALERIEVLQPNVVVMDVDMPQMNGLEATRRIKRSFPQISIIGLSFHEERETMEAMYRAGASAYLRKGGDTETMLRTIREMKKQ